MPSADAMLSPDSVTIVASQIDVCMFSPVHGQHCVNKTYITAPYLLFSCCFFCFHISLCNDVKITHVMFLYLKCAVKNASENLDVITRDLK